MMFFPVLVAHVYNLREGVSLATMSLFLRRRRKRALKLGLRLPPDASVNLCYPYFGLCLFSTSIHASDDTMFFWGLCVILSWALWTQRSRRFGLAIWAGSIGVAVLTGYFGQHSMGQLQGFLSSYNPQWLTRLTGRTSDPEHNQTAIGMIGRLKESARIVIRLETEDGWQPPDYLREASYRIYKSASWYSGSARQGFDRLGPEKAGGTTFAMVPGKTNIATINIACYLDDGEGATREGLLPLPENCGRLENMPAYGLRINRLGTVIAEGPGLVMFDALYGPGESLDSPPDPSGDDVLVSPRERKALDQVIGDLKLSGLPTNEILRKVSAYFHDGFTYSTWRDSENDDVLGTTPLGAFS